MQTISEPRNATRSGVAKTVKPINFFCSAPQAQSVYLMGDFNGWNPSSLPMQRRVDGWWSLQIPLGPGHHRYQFLVDGKPTLDPHANGVTHTERYARVSLIAVS
jgi:1,4-alpha-glucan branching enzyme